MAQSGPLLQGLSQAAVEVSSEALDISRLHPSLLPGPTRERRSGTFHTEAIKAPSSANPFSPPTM